MVRQSCSDDARTGFVRHILDLAFFCLTKATICQGSLPRTWTNLTGIIGLDVHDSVEVLVFVVVHKVLGICAVGCSVFPCFMHLSVSFPVTGIQLVQSPKSEHINTTILVESQTHCRGRGGMEETHQLRELDGSMHWPVAQVTSKPPMLKNFTVEDSSEPNNHVALLDSECICLCE